MEEEKTNLIMRKIFILSLLVISFAATAQTNTQQPNPYIDVTGKAEKEIIPNEIYIGFPLKERMEKGKKVTINLQETRLKQALKEIGIPVENLSVSDVSSSLLKTGWWKKNVLAKADYTLKVSSTKNLKQLLNRFESLKIKQARVVKVDHSDMVLLRKQNRIAAIKAAKEKAKYLLEAIGENVGKPLIVNEQQSHRYDNLHRYNQLNVVPVGINYKQESKDPDSGVAFEKIRIVSTVYVKFQIK